MELSSTITADVAKEAEAHGFLNPNDGVAISFWIISIMMVAATVFFLMESMAVGNHWKTSMNVGALVTLVAGVHSFCMLLFGYCGETSIIGAWVGFALGLAGWGFILAEIFVGEAGQCAGSDTMSKHVASSFATMRY